MAEVTAATDDAPFDVTPASARARYAKMHDMIRQRICLLDYAPGMRLSEEALAAEFGTSRTPVRRVLARLEDAGLVTSVHGVGTFVTDANITELQQVYELRVELAEMLGRLSPKPPDAALMEEFRDLAARSRRMMATRDPRAFTELDMEFFRALMKLSGNASLREVTELLYYRTKRIWIKSAVAAQIELGEEFVIFNREVEDVVAALEVGDLQAAANIRKAHISMSFKRLMKAALRDRNGEASAELPQDSGS